MKDTNKSEYRTGPTAPPKNYGSLIAVLLVAVILFGGLASILSIMNIRLLDNISLAEKEDVPIHFAPAAEPNTTPAFALTTETVTPFLGNYYHLPEGVCLTEVGPAAKEAGLLSGDIILAIDDVPVTDKTAFAERLLTLTGEDSVILTIYRNQETMTLTISLSKED